MQDLTDIERQFVDDCVRIFTERMRRKGFEVLDDGEKLRISDKGVLIATYRKMNFRPSRVSPLDDSTRSESK